MTGNKPRFRLHDFLRMAWVSQTAQSTWQPRVASIRETWPKVAIALVRDGFRNGTFPCVIRSLPPWMIFGLQAEARHSGVSVQVLGLRGVAVPGYLTGGSTPPSGKPFCYEVAIGREPVVASVERAWDARRFGEAYRLAGLPECCVCAAEIDIAEERVDATWRLSQGVASDVKDVKPPTPADAMWRWLHIQPSGFLPCRLECACARQIGDQWIAAGIESGFGQEIHRAAEIFSWPVEWSALHGIAELRTPILKLAFTTDATSRKQTVRFHGSGYPAEGGKGLAFPYQPSTAQKLTESSSFRRGLENLIQIG